MQTGEIVTYILGLIALFMVVSILLYYRYCKKSKLLFSSLFITLNERTLNERSERQYFY